MKILKVIFIILYIILLIIPFYTLLINPNGIGDFKTLSSKLFFFQRLFGFYALVLLFVQIIIGAFMLPLRKLYGKNLLMFHATQGIITYAVLFSHPTFYVLLNIQSFGLIKGFFALLPNLGTLYEYYVTFGKIAFYLFTIGVLAGLFRKKPLFSKHWRKFHILNYVAFFLALYHSWNIGSDSQTPPFSYLYPIFVIGLFVAVFYKRFWGFIKKPLIVKSKKSVISR